MLDHSAGTLTASSAVIVDANSKIDQLKSGNMVVTGSSNTISTSSGNLTIAPTSSLVVTHGGTVDFSGQANSLTLPDNQAAALDINEGGTSYLKFTTTYSSEKVVVGKDMDTGTVNVTSGNFLVGTDKLTVASGTGNTVIKGTANIQGAADLDSTLNVDGNTTLNGNVTLGNAGADTVQLLEELGLGQQRTLRALRSMALASDDVKEALSSANEEFALNNALQTEAEKRYETVVSQMGILRNNITALGIETGNTLLEPLNEVIEGLTTIAGGTTSDELKRMVAGFAAMAVTLNMVAVSRKKMIQLNQVAQSQGLMGTGAEGSISFLGDVLPSGPFKGELAHRRRARSIQGRGGSTFNKKDFLAQQAGMGRQTRGFQNILDNAQIMDVDLFDADPNQALLDKIGGFTETAPEDIRFLEPDVQEKVIGSAEILEIFKVSKVGKVAGSKVIDGEILQDSNARIIRDGTIIFNGKIGSIFREKNQAKQVSAGLECGITIKDFNDFQKKDIIEVYKSTVTERRV